MAAVHRDVLETVVPLSADVERMGQARAPVEEFAPRGGAAAAFRELWKEIRTRLV
jgi:chromosome partitioning protein